METQPKFQTYGGMCPRASLWASMLSSAALFQKKILELKIFTNASFGSLMRTFQAKFLRKILVDKFGGNYNGNFLKVKWQSKAHHLCHQCLCLAWDFRSYPILSQGLATSPLEQLAWEQEMGTERHQELQRSVVQQHHLMETSDLKKKMKI